jgi:hypothetical protein
LRSLDDYKKQFRSEAKLIPVRQQPQQQQSQFISTPESSSSTTSSTDLRPRIITKLVDQYANFKTEKVVFVCEFSQGAEHSQINWYHNEILIKISGNENKYIIQNEVNRSILYIFNVDFEDSGSYQFKIQNNFGSDYSAASLTVYKSIYV